jgi:hypothetical protein
VPRFAIPEPDPAKRVAWLRKFEHRLATAKSVDEIDAFCKAAPSDAGIQIEGTRQLSENPDGSTKDTRDYEIRFVPPVSAIALADVFHWSPAVGVTFDVHMVSWYLERRDGDSLPIAGADSQWRVEAALTGWPKDTTTKPARRPQQGGYLISKGDEVNWLVVKPR